MVDILEMLILMIVIVGLTFFVKHTQAKHGVNYGKMCSVRPLKEELLEKVGDEN